VAAKTSVGSQTGAHGGATRSPQDLDPGHKRGVSERVTFHAVDAGDEAVAGRYDLVTAFECIHDMPDAMSALSTMRRLRGYAHEAGFAGIEILPIETDFWRFYRLR